MQNRNARRIIGLSSTAKFCPRTIDFKDECSSHDIKPIHPPNDARVKVGPCLGGSHVFKGTERTHALSWLVTLQAAALAANGSAYLHRFPLPNSAFFLAECFSYL
jgi:hypothetical protein